MYTCLFSLQGSIVTLADGTVLHPDGTMEYPDGTVRKPNNMTYRFVQSPAWCSWKYAFGIRWIEAIISTAKATWRRHEPPLGKSGFQLGGVNRAPQNCGEEGGFGKRAQLTGPLISYYDQQPVIMNSGAFEH